MPPTTRVGAPIKARLSAKYDPERGGSLTETEASQARRVIKALRRTDEKGRCAAGKVTIPGRGRVELSVSRGAVAVNGLASSVEKSSASVADTVCAAVKRGLFTAEHDPRAPEDPNAYQREPSESSESESSQYQSDPRPVEKSSDGESDGESKPEDKTRAESSDGPSQSDDSGEDGESEAESDSEAESEDGESDQAESEAEAESKPESKPDPEHELEHLLRRFRELAEYCDSGESEVTDVVSNRAYIDGARMLRVGIPVRGILHAWAVNWPETARRAVGIESWDPESFAKRAGRHRLYGYVRGLIEADVPVYLKGPTQAGKSHVLAEVAGDLGLPFRACPLIAGASSSWLLGAWTPEGFVEAGFPEIYGGGGIFLFDEVDAADPNMVTVLNNALSNSHLENPRRGTVIERGELFRASAAANTWGTGATADHTGRARLDKATLERFRLGRVEFGYDRELQERLARENYAGDSAPSASDEDAEALIEALRERLGVK